MSGRIDPRKAKTLEEACANGDGTYNGYRLLSFLSEAIRPGHGFSEEEVRTMAAKHGVRSIKDVKGTNSAKAQTEAGEEAAAGRLLSDPAFHALRKTNGGYGD